ncbi:MAG: hypothetical protein KDI30_03475, partial [Pseudomonadales bacterium]|nr:hypothetical protein [Pseudomonadales bacterium]
HQSGIKVRVNAAPWIPGISNAEEIVKRTPDGVLVAFGPLELDNSHYDVLIGVNKTSAAKALGKQFTQNEINKAYVAERNRLKDLKNTCWYYPIIPDETGKIPIFKTFKAGEITL